MLKAIVIEGQDGELSHLLRQALLLFPEMTFFGSAHSIQAGISLICETDPDIVLLDLDLPDGNGLEILRKTLGFQFKTIVTSESVSHALRAQRYGISDFVQKRLSLASLAESLEKAMDKPRGNSIHQLFQSHFRTGTQLPLEYVAVKQEGRLSFVRIAEIEFISAHGGSVQIAFVGGGFESCGYSISKMAQRLKNSGFFRISTHVLVNLGQLSEFVGTNSIRMQSGKLWVLDPVRMEKLRRITVC